MKRAAILLIWALCACCDIIYAREIEPGRSADDISKHIYVTLDVPKTTIYVNERVPVALNLYSDRLNVSPVSVGKIKGENLVVDDFSASESAIIKQGDVTFRQVRYPAALVAPIAGQFTVVSDTVKADLAGSGRNDMLVLLNRNEDFYENFVGPSGKRSLELTAAPVSITVLPLPRDGRPDDFTGAVGDFSFDLLASDTEVKLDNNITLTMTIKGAGNYSSVSAPQMKKAAGIKRYAPQVTKTADSVIFEQVVRIKSPDVREIPEAVFSFFSPGDKKYISITKGPIPIRVTAPAAGAAAPAGRAKEAEGKKEWVDALKDVEYPPEERAAPFYRKSVFFMFEAIPLLIALAVVIAYAIARYLEMHPLYTASFVASRRARKGIIKAASILGHKSSKEFYNLIFRIMQGYLGTRRLKPVDGVTSDIIYEIDMTGIERDIGDRIRKIFYECYAVKYTKEDLGKDDMRNTLDELKYVVDSMNKKAEL